MGAGMGLVGAVCQCLCLVYLISRRLGSGAVGLGVGKSARSQHAVCGGDHRQCYRRHDFLGYWPLAGDTVSGAKFKSSPATGNAQTLAALGESVVITVMAADRWRSVVPRRRLVEDKPLVGPVVHDHRQGLPLCVFVVVGVNH